MLGCAMIKLFQTRVVDTVRRSSSQHSETLLCGILALTNAKHIQKSDPIHDANDIMA